MDSAYTSLLTHLHRPSSTLSISALQASIAYYLAHPPVHQPSPTALTASAAASPRFRAHDPAALGVLGAAFQHAAHIRRKVLEDEGTSLFSRSVRTRLGAWAADVLEGLRGARSAVRLVCAGGLLTGLDGVQRGRDGVVVSVRGRVEDEVVVALAEVMDLYTYGRGGDSARWEAEFRPAGEKETPDVLALALALAAPYFALIPTRKLRALPLSTLATALTATIVSTFKAADGSFLSGIPTSISKNPDTPMQIKHESKLREDVKRLMASPSFTSLPALSKFLARTISVLADSRPVEVWEVMDLALDSFIELNLRVESDWASSPLSEAASDNDIAEDSREASTQIWTALKTLLFSTLMLAQAVLSVAAYLPAPAAPAAERTPAHLALRALRALAPLAFVIAQFGGLGAAPPAGLAELQRAAYGALDVLAADARASEELVRALGASVRADAASSAVGRARGAFALACVEQLVPVLDEVAVAADVVPMCLPFLDDAAHRETFEAAHSTMLAVFAAHAARAAAGRTAAGDGALAARLVPAYAASLVQNGGEGGLNTRQLRLASAALVRSAAAEGTDAADARAWLVVDAIAAGAAKARAAGDARRARALVLALAACISVAPRKLLPRVLEAVRETAAKVSKGPEGEEERKELAGMVFEEILGVGDAERLLAMRWWDENAVELGGRDWGEQDDVDVGAS